MTFNPTLKLEGTLADQERQAREQKLNAALILAGLAIHGAKLVLKDEKNGYTDEGPAWFEQALRDAELYVQMAREAYES
jgi:hypothetical protein